MKLFVKLSFLLAIVIFFSSCSRNFVVNADYDRSVDFNQYRTYELQKPQRLRTDDRVLQSPIMKRRIARSIEAEMNARGYRQVEQGGDLMVRFQKDIEQRQEQETHYQHMPMAPMGYWGGWGWGGHPMMMGGFGPWGWGGGMMSARAYDRIRTFEEGRIVIDIIDTRTDDLVWQGWSIGEVDGYRRSQRDMERSIRRKVAEIFERYPGRGPGEPVEQRDATSKVNP